MKAIVYEATGPSSVLKLQDKALTEPGPDEVRVRLVVSGVNPTDWKSRSGSGSRKLDAPKVPNQDGAGVIDQLGSGVTGFDVGDRVWLWDVAWGSNEGTAQEYVVVPAHKAVVLPDAESFDTGASLGIPALTAHRALTSNEDGPARLSPGALAGRTVLVTGGAGAVGHAAIQLAKWAGAAVLTTVSGDRKAGLALRAGAGKVINYRKDDVVHAVHETAPDGVDIIVDVNAPANIEADLHVLKPGGTISIYAANPGESLTVPIRESMTRNVRYQFVLTYTVTDEQKQNAVAAVAEALAAGALRVGEEHGLPLTRFALEETPAAHDAVEQGTIGKVLIDVASAS
ncbi:NADPH2:quinone reductase [Arthrobacter ulcerisalmonis]|uniref:NADPH:quinone reductase n=1 Tax=Arthrobacter sp. B1I2 TaxID=3042263 RepID=UPI0027866708|nr:MULTISPECIES: NADPH:quinone reductase [Arthrobacter]MDQ0664300.1 NADPH2:quinone reductase [Arthrobacter ulcerisalmonis]MDQ0732210.1 NADPH2:quinone reductase [Arthrobacter sp. B1I2]